MSSDKEDKIKRELVLTTSAAHYNGWNNRTTYGYHSYNLEGVLIEGQRKPSARLSHMRQKIDFKNKNVLDLGCNVGSMLHHLSPEINRGIGLDFDAKCITAAKNISDILEYDNLNFHIHDFDKNSYKSMFEKVDFKPDIVFILSLGSWVKNWKPLYLTCLKYECVIVLETNNDTEGAPQLEFFQKNGLTIESLAEHSKDDSTGNHGRKTYLISREDSK